MDKKNNYLFLPITFIGIILCACLFFGCDWNNKSTKTNNNVSTQDIQVNASKKITDGQFGVWTNAFAANPGEKFDENIFQKQVQLWKDLGMNNLRTNFERSGWQPLDKFNDLMVKSAQDNNLKLTFIVESPFEDFFKDANYDSGYKWGQLVGEKYSGKVGYYQLANEVSGTVILPNRNGLKEEDYDPDKYKILKNYILGLSKGLKDADPNAKQIVSAHWLGLGVIDKLLNDGLDIDVIGWNWYSDMGEDITTKKLDEGDVLNIPEHFAKYGKEFWITELNYNAGDSSGEDKQAEFLKNFLDNCKNSGMVKGYFVYKLVDSICTEGDKPTSHLGIVKDDFSNKTVSGCDIGETKKAFDIYKNFISTNK